MVIQRIFSALVVICVVLNLTTADYKDEALALHNKYRAIHHSPPLTLKKEVNNFAKDYAKKMLTVGFKHSKGKYGENLYWNSNSTMTDTEAVIKAVNAWYAEEKLYKYNTPKFSSATGHFTQVVWKSTSYLGISVSRSKSKVYVCANYDRPGNVQGKFPENVLKP